MDATYRTWTERGSTGLAPKSLDKFGAARPVHKPRSRLAAGKVLIAPPNKRDEHWRECYASRREPIFEPSRVLLIWLPRHEASGDQLAQSAGQNWSRNAQIGAQFIEPPDTPAARSARTWVHPEAQRYVDTKRRRMGHYDASASDRLG